MTGRGQLQKSADPPPPSIVGELDLARAYVAALDAGNRQRVGQLRNRIATARFDPTRASAILRALTARFGRYDRSEPPVMRGVYLLAERGVLDGAGGDCYVGLSTNINRRFLDGHHRTGGTRADVLQSADTIFAVPVRTSDLRVAETLLYLLARAAGLDPLNQVGSLAHHVEHAAELIVSCRVHDGQLALHRGLLEAARALGIRNSIAPVLSRYQNQVGGYTFRYATDLEAAVGKPIATSSDAAFRGRALRWSRGGVMALIRRGLQRTRRYAPRSEGGFYGVTRTDRAVGRWTARLVRPGDPPNNPKEIVGRRFMSPLAAHEAREAFIAEHPAFAACNRRGPRSLRTK